MWSLVLFACVDPDPCGPVEESVDDTYTGWANVSVITGAETAWMVALDWDDLIWRPLVGDQVASEGSTVALYHRFTSNSVLGAQWISPTEVAVFTEFGVLHAHDGETEVRVSPYSGFDAVPAEAFVQGSTVWLVGSREDTLVAGRVDPDGRVDHTLALGPLDPERRPVWLQGGFRDEGLELELWTPTGTERVQLDPEGNVLRRRAYPDQGLPYQRDRVWLGEDHWVGVHGNNLFLFDDEGEVASARFPELDGGAMSSTALGTDPDGNVFVVAGTAPLQAARLADVAAGSRHERRLPVGPGEGGDIFYSY